MNFKRKKAKIAASVAGAVVIFTGGAAAAAWLLTSTSTQSITLGSGPALQPAAQCYASSTSGTVGTQGASPCTTPAISGDGVTWGSLTDVGQTFTTGDEILQYMTTTTAYPVAASAISVTETGSLPASDLNVCVIWDDSEPNNSDTIIYNGPVSGASNITPPSGETVPTNGLLSTGYIFNISAGPALTGCGSDAAGTVLSVNEQVNGLDPPETASSAAQLPSTVQSDTANITAQVTFPGS